MAQPLTLMWSPQWDTLTVLFLIKTVVTCYNTQSWSADKGKKLEPSTKYYPQTDSQSEIVIKEIMPVAVACKAEGNEWLSKMLEIQLKLNSLYNPCRNNNPFITVVGFDTKLGLDTFSYSINKYQPGTERHNATPQDLHNAKAS